MLRLIHVHMRAAAAASGLIVQSIKTYFLNDDDFNSNYGIAKAATGGGLRPGGQAAGSAAHRHSAHIQQADDGRLLRQAGAGQHTGATGSPMYGPTRLHVHLRPFPAYAHVCGLPTYVYTYICTCRQVLR